MNFYYPKLVEILNVVSEFKTAVNFIFIKKCHAISRMNHATIGTNFLASLWLAPSNKKDKDVQQGTETNRDIKKQVTITKHYHLDTTKQQILSTTANLIIAKIENITELFVIRDLVKFTSEMSYEVFSLLTHHEKKF